MVRQVISQDAASQQPKRPLTQIVPGNLVYVEFESDAWHLGCVQQHIADFRFDVKFHDGEEAEIDFEQEPHCMADRY